MADPPRDCTRAPARRRKTRPPPGGNKNLGAHGRARLAPQTFSARGSNLDTTVIQNHAESFILTKLDYFVLSWLLGGPEFAQFDPQQVPPPWLCNHPPESGRSDIETQNPLTEFELIPMNRLFALQANFSCRFIFKLEGSTVRPKAA